MQGDNEKNHDLKGICEDAASKAQAWMLTHLKNLYRTETVRDPMKYYKWPLALAKRGKDAEAVRLLKWIAQQCMTPSGDLISDRSGFHKEFYTYANLWLVLAAIKLGEDEFLEPSLDFLLHWHNEQTGGLITNPLADTEDMTEDPLSTSFLGWAACELKDAQRAQRALAYLMHWIDQPLDDDRLWLRTLRDGTLINHLPEHADPSTYVIEMGEQDESYYFLGSVCFFLANYIRVFKKGDAPELVEKVAGLLENIGPEALQGFHVGYGNSGVGGDDGTHGLETYMRKKTVYVNYSGGPTVGLMPYGG